MIDALIIATIGMSVVFASLGILLLVMWLLGRFLKDGTSPKSSVPPGT